MQQTAQNGPAPRRTSDSGRSGARTRGGLGAPLPALPPSADVPGSAASGARASRPAPGPHIQRAPARRDEGGSAATPDCGRTPTEAAPPARGDGRARGAGAPLLGSADVQRRVADDSVARDTTSPGHPADHGTGPATPLVTPPSAPAGTPAPEGSVPHPGPQQPQVPGAPGPVVVARAVAEGTPDAGTLAADRPSAQAAPRPHRTAARTPGAAGPDPLTVTGSGALSAPAAPLTLQLLPARPLTLSTRATEGTAQPAAAPSGTRPVVPMRWPGAPAAPQGQGGTGTPAHPAPGPSAGAPATPHVQRAANPDSGPAAPQIQRASTAHPGPAAQAAPYVQRAATLHAGPQNSGPQTPGSSVSVQRVPVVQPVPPGHATPGASGPAAAVPGRALPVTAPLTPPLADRPAGSAPSASAAAGNVPVVRPRAAAPGGGATPVQRAPYAADDSVLTGKAAKPTLGRQRSHSAAGDLATSRVEAAGSEQVRGRPRSASESSASGKAAAKRTARRAETPQDPGLDLDDLARRLIDPVSRLLRTELRRGRERTGRPYDGRR
ncbi:hypothetical protein [Streptomyces sp. FIT100]|uniref:hypothetical protein n=1 Tax=Streptomyces sp. FIT100 TaxID=2837956 RepID=UPI0021C82336|nr:hypothetical protein [Streptomyces sp. FIT100]UUN26501.1 hypothetical protein KK483_08785 [Streptomyces sp. FIT100]